MFSLHLDTARTWRGGQNQVLLTVLGMRALEHRAVLIAHPEGELYRRATEGPDLVPLAVRSEIDLSAGWKLSRVIRQYAPAVVHAHDPHATAVAALALSFLPASSCPCLIASRRVDFPLQGNSFSRWKYRQVRLFLAASQAIADVLVRSGIPRAQVVVVHDGIDVGKVGRLPALDLRSELWLPRGVPVIATVGALVPHKGHKVLIEAMPLVRQQVPDAHLVIFGEGELRGALERQIRDLLLEKYVLLPGFRPDVLQLVKGADLFVMSSLTEGLGSAILDAMAMRLAVVGTHAGGIPEAVEDGVSGLLVPHGRSVELAEAIVALLTNPARREAMGEAGRARVSAHFGVGRMLQETLAAYEMAGGLRP